MRRAVDQFGTSVAARAFFVKNIAPLLVMMPRGVNPESSPPMNLLFGGVHYCQVKVVGRVLLSVDVYSADPGPELTGGRTG